MVNILGVHENLVRQQYWFACDSGLCIYDKRSRQMWYKNYDPQNLPIFKNKRIQSNLSEVYIDGKQRIWLFGWPTGGDREQDKYCLDSTGSSYLKKDTIGLDQGITGIDYRYFYETRQGELWIYGFNVLINYDKNTGRFNYNKSSEGNENITINYESVFQILEDKDGNIWIATNQGIYYTATASANSSVVNLIFNNKNGPSAINDILQVPDGNLWFTSFRYGVTTTDKYLRKIPNVMFRQPPPANWPQTLKAAALQTVSLCRQSATGNIWIGCKNAVLMIHNPDKKTTQYLHPPELNNSTINFIAEDKQGQIWMGTEGGRLVKWSNNKFIPVQDIGTLIYKVFIDKQGWLWLATRGSGLYAIDPANGKILQHYTANGGKNSLYSNIGTDIEQLHNNLIVLAAGALHFIDKRTGTVSVIKYEDGLPSNTVARVRTDVKGFLWIITSNGLCSYNPNNKRITPYGRKDGVVLAEQTISADEITSNGNLIFGGSNAVLMFNPAILLNTKKPPDVTITDFKVLDRYLPVDSLMRNSQIKLHYDENSLSIYFESLSYRERDKLTYYYKMEGVDKDWIKADRSYFVNYSLQPPGKYSFQVFCENIEGMRSSKTTELNIYIQPPFYKTYWFLGLVLIVIAFIFYGLHRLRINKILAMEALRNRVARDLHDDMGSTLSTINILSSMAVTKMNADELKTREYLSKISENSQRMMEAMDDIVWSIKPSNDSMQKIIARMREFATNVLEAKDIHLDFKVSEEVYNVKLNMQASRDFFLVFKEAINNAAKYSKANEVQVHLSLNNKQLVLLVKDDGAGFNIEEADGNGLGNMQKRADAMNGIITIQTKQAEGTTVNLVIPVVK